MEFATIFSRAAYGIQALPVTIEVHLSPGLPRFTMVGLPETAVKESKDRVRSAILMSHFVFPDQRITVNLAPADLPKEGGRFDLAIAIGILLASAQLRVEHISHYELVGELALSGALRPVSSCLATALAVKQQDQQLIAPADNLPEAELVEGLQLQVAHSLLQVCEYLQGETIDVATKRPVDQVVLNYPDLGEVRGQAHAKQCLEVAASGGHSVLMTGPPGSGKTLLASCLPGILPPLTTDEAYETAMMLSLKSELQPAQWRQRPFRAPHHSASAAALVGGGNPPQPGEVSLSHHGVLFLDEFPEFQRHVLEMLREPLQSGYILLSRAGHQLQYPAAFQLIAAMNPCPCGYWGDKQTACRCSHQQIQRYRAKLSGPLLDRIDCHIQVPRLSLQHLHTSQATEDSATVRERVIACRQRQLTRQGKINAKLSHQDIKTHCQLQRDTESYLTRYLDKMCCSARVYYKTLRLARTLADMEAKTAVELGDVQMALQFREYDMSY